MRPTHRVREEKQEERREIETRSERGEMRDDPIKSIIKLVAISYNYLLLVVNRCN